MKNKEVIAIEEKDLAMFEDFNNANSNRIDGTISRSQENFGVLKRNNIFNNGFNTIENAYNDAKQSINNYLKVVSSYYQDMNINENRHVDYVNMINTPKSYSLNDYSTDFVKKELIMSKNDSTSVNEGSKDTRLNEYDDNSNIVLEQLENMKKNEEIKEEKYDDSSIINKQEDLLNIEKEENNEEKVYDDLSIIDGQEKIASINNEKEQDESNYDSSSVLVKDALNNINNSSTLSEAELDNASQIQKNNSDKMQSSKTDLEQAIKEVLESKKDELNN